MIGLPTLTVLLSFLWPTCTANCHFPKFLWSHGSANMPGDGASGETVEKHWTTHALFASGEGSNWTSVHEVSVRSQQITIKVVTRAVCFDQHTNVTISCPRKDLYRRINCLQEEVDEKFRVQIKGNGISEFGCMRFFQRGQNIVQIWAAQPSRTNDASLCYNHSIERDPWPWITHKKEQWSFCPFTGGFDFRVYFPGRKKPVCSKSKHQWRPSRMESECILGEGIQVHFPDERCNIFDGNNQSIHVNQDGPLYCWGSWIESQHQFTIIGKAGQSYPQYTMRLPVDTDSLKEFNAIFYYSPVAPIHETIGSLSDEGRDPDGISSVNIQMLRTDPGICYDESEYCPEFAREGKCINSALHKYANFCKKSCGLCGHKADLVPSTRSECYFPEEYRGKWWLFETDRREEVTIDRGQVTFSNLGSFICKSKHWKKDQYKMLSVYKDGCRPRYSCLHFRLDGIVLNFQLSKSSLLDRSFDLCDFRDDPDPLKDKIRSKRMKLLLPDVRMRNGSCGLSGTVPVNATFFDGVTCDGLLSDWDPTTCGFKPSMLSLSLRYCGGRELRDFHCIANIDINDGTSVLITQESLQRDTFQCWVLHTHSERMSYRPWKQVFVFDRGQCGTANDLMALSRDNLMMTIYTYTDSISNRCSSSPVTPPNRRMTSSKPDFNAPSHRWPRYTVLPKVTAGTGSDGRPPIVDAQHSNDGFNHATPLSTGSSDLFPYYLVSLGCCLYLRLSDWTSRAPIVYRQ